MAKSPRGSSGKLHPQTRKRANPNVFQAWLPFAIVTTYLVTSIYLYMTCTDTTIKSLWFLYLASSFIRSSVAVLEAHLSTKPFEAAKKRLESLRETGTKLGISDDELPLMNLVFVAYLPNEKDIIIDTLTHALENVDYPRAKLRVDLVYNTPYSLPEVEERLADLSLTHSNFRSTRVFQSITKAENVNWFLTTFKPHGIVALFDADHRPAPLAPRTAAARFLREPHVAAIQGRCKVYNTAASFVAGFCGCDQDRFSTVWQPGRAAAWGFALFTGSNGYWRAAALRAQLMSPDAVIEDVDLSLRALAAGATIVHDCSVVSLELGPTTWAAYKSQRVRWAQGYAQLAWQFAGLAVRRDVPVRTRLGILSLLWVREINHYFVTQSFLLTFTILLRYLTGAPEALWECWFHPVTYLSAAASIATGNIFMRIHKAQRSEFITDRMSARYAYLFPYYAAVVSTIGILGHAKEACRFSAWKESATQRGDPAQVPSL